MRQCGWLCAKTADIRLFCCKNICQISGRSCGVGLHSAQFYVIIPDELNRKQQVPSAALRGEKGKREAGADPARSRHCDKGVHCQGAFAPVTEPSGLGRRQRALIFQSGNLPAVGTGALPPQITRNWLYQKACKIRGLFALPFRKQKAPFFADSLSCTLLFSAVFYPHQERKTR